MPGMLGNMGRFASPLSNMPKPNVTGIKLGGGKITGKIPGKKVAGLGNDPLKLMKRFFLYKNMFGEGGEKISGLGPGGIPKPAGSLNSGPSKLGGSPGNVQALASARRLGII
jgi:hypothetical protein